jgi:hypothetical protein
MTSTTQSPNNVLLVEPYKSTGLSVTVNKGFARVDQKTNIVPLKVIADLVLNTGITVSKGDLVYLRQEDLEVQGWAKKMLQFRGVECIMVPLQDAVVIEHLHGEPDAQQQNQTT